MAVKYTDYMPFRYDSSFGVDVNDDPFQQVASLVTDDLPAGQYIATVNVISDFQSANDRIQWRVTGTNPSPLFIDECKDPDEVITDVFAIPFTWSGGVITLNIEARADQNVDVTIVMATAIIQRVA